MNDNGLNIVMDLIERQKWEKLFKTRELVHVDAVKEFYARLTMSHNRKKDVARSSVRGVEIEFDHMMLASILDIPVDKQGEEPKRYDYFEDTFLTMCKLIRENGVWWIGTGENRRRDDEVVAPAEEVHEEEEVQNDFDWEAVVDEATVQGESGSDDQFFDAQVDVEEPITEVSVSPAFPASPGDSTNQQKEQTPVGVDPSGPFGHIPESVMIKLQVEFERARANRIQSDLEKAQAENAKLSALLQQAHSKPKP
ncbi:hypothetical protein Dimus_015635 [Dionaea muscipula]